MTVTVTVTVTVAETVTATVAETESVTEPGHAEKAPHRDVPGTLLCRNDHPATRRAAHNSAAGHSAGSAIRFGSSGSEGGCRRASSVVTHFPVSSNDHAARATLGRQGRPRRPGLKETESVAVTVTVAMTVTMVAVGGPAALGAATLGDADFGTMNDDTSGCGFLARWGIEDGIQGLQKCPRHAFEHR